MNYTPEEYHRMTKMDLIRHIFFLTSKLNKQRWQINDLKKKVERMSEIIEQKKEE